MLLTNEIETIYASQIGVRYDSKIVNIYVRTNDEMVTITERKENIQVFLKMLKSIHSQVFELYIGDHCFKKYRIRLPLKNLELVVKELQPLINDLDISRNLPVS